MVLRGPEVPVHVIRPSDGLQIGFRPKSGFPPIFMTAYSVPTGRPTRCQKGNETLQGALIGGSLAFGRVVNRV